jgi:hypothetical protein
MDKLLNVLKDIPKILKDIPKTIVELMKMLPLLIKALIFMVTTVPKFIINFLKSVTKFIKSAKPLVFAVIISFFAVYFGIQYLFGYLTGMNGVIPAIPLALLSLYIIVDLVMNNSSQLKVLQSILLKGFIFIFNNPLLKDLLGFDVKIDEKNPAKTTEKIIAWALKNFLKIIITLFALGIGLKIFIQKLWSYVTFYS